MGKLSGKTVHSRSSSSPITAQPWLAMWLNTGEASHSNEYKSSCGVQHLPALLGCLFRFSLEVVTWPPVTLPGSFSMVQMVPLGSKAARESMVLFSGSMLELGWGRCPIVVFATAAGTMHKAHFVLHRPELQVQQYQPWNQESKPQLQLASSVCRVALYSVLGDMSRAVMLSRF